MINPSKFPPYILKRTARMTTEPVTCKAVLEDDHRQAYEHSIGNAKFIIAGESIAAEDKTTYDGLHQIVCKTHTTEYA